MGKAKIVAAFRSAEASAVQLHPSKAADGPMLMPLRDAESTEATRAE